MTWPDGLVIADKPAGLTSHDLVGRVRRLAGTRRVGHAGTLDPMATGVLVLGLGRATRLLTYLVGCDKAYAGTIRLGATTVTDDAEGTILTSPGARGLEAAAVRAAMTGLTGPIQQVPSAVSAIKVNGQRAYARVRAGQAVELPPSAVEVSRFDLVAARPVGEFLDLDVEVECSSGTYIRALARDLGATLGVGGHLTALRRRRVGPYDEDQARDIGGLSEADVLPLAQAAAARFPVRWLTALEAVALS
ncbi:MAG: tRNA pseudouridine(55) synthase TruB, partial [Bifidobacteriaceae bacterium]|nr:tRNA pseudouridine(55) synthase TruB [Bifidobacteriaceae bacterium]